MKKHILITTLLLIVLATLCPSYARAASQQYIWPTTTHVLSRNFTKHSSKAIDISVPVGTEVVASREGTVYAVYRGCNNFSGLGKRSCRDNGCSPNCNFYPAYISQNNNKVYCGDYCNNGFGNGVIIKHSDGSFESYAHMSTVDVEKDQYIDQGQRIGTSGSTGFSGGPHLHVEIRSGDPFHGEIFNPEILFNGGKPTVNTTTGTADTVTETSAILRGSFSVTNGRATECGMYLGTSSSSMEKLGLDKVSTAGTSMFYSTSKYGRTLTPGTTYYYQAYVIVNDSETRGSVESFTTKGNPPAPALSVSLSSDSLTLEYGTSNKLTASTTPAGLPVTWKSSDESVVTVKDGVVTAIGSGTAHVVAIVYGDKKSASDFCTVTVQDQPDSIKPAPVDPDIKLAQSTVTLNIGERTSLRAITTPEGQPVRWNSSNETAATVDPNNGTVTAVGIGTATITAYMEYDGSTYFTLCSVTVKRTTPDVSISVSGVTNIAQTTARVNASCAYGAGCRPSSVGLYLGTSPSSLSYWKSDDGITHNKNPFDIWYNLSGLSAGTTYYYQFYAKTDRGEVRSDVDSFTTESLNLASSTGNTRVAVVVNTNGQYLAINDAPAASPHYSTQIGRIPPIGAVIVDLSKSSGNWYYVEYNGVNGYAYSKYLSLR